MTDSQQAGRPVSGTYRGAAADGPGRLIEIRVDVDGHRPQRKVSGDVYRRSWFLGAELTSYVEMLTVTNDTAGPIELPRDLSPEAGTVRIHLRRPNGDVVEHRPPARRMVAPGDTVTVQPGASYAVSIPLSFAATGPAFPIAGEYRISAALTPAPDTVLASNGARLRVRRPAARPGRGRPKP